MTERSAEDAGTVILIGPGYHCLGVALRATRHHLGAGHHLNVVVQLLIFGGPIFQPLGDERHVVFKRNINRTLRTVPAGLQADVLKPFAIRRTFLHRRAEIAEPIRVHRAMKVYARDTLLVRREHTGDHLRITDARRALVVNHQIVTLCIIGIAINGDRRLGTFVRRMGVIDLDIDPALQSLFQNILLVRIIMAAPARDQQRPQRLGQRLLFILGIEIPSKPAGQCKGQNNRSHKFVCSVMTLPAVVAGINLCQPLFRASPATPFRS